MDKGRSIKIPNACGLCKQRKRRCDGQTPCRYCTDKGVADECSYTAPLKRGPKKGAVYKKRAKKGDSADPSGEAHPMAPSAAPHSSTSPPIPQLPPAPLAPFAQVPRPPPADPSTFPEISAPILSHLVTIHAEYVNACTGVALLDAEVPLNLKSTTPALLYAVAGASAPFSTHPLVAASSVSGGMDWTRRARELLLDNHDSRFSEQGVQALVTLGCDALARGDGRQARLDCATALSTALLLGFDEVHAPASQHRTLWTIYALEVTLCGEGRSMDHAEAVVSHLPLPVHSSSNPIYLSTTELSSQHIDRLDPFCLRALHLLRRVRALSPSPLDRAADWQPSSPFALLSLELSDWGDLPIGANFNSTVLASLQGREVTTFATAHLAHHLAYLFLFRPYLPLQGEAQKATDDSSLFIDSCRARALTHAICLGRILVACSAKSSYGITPLGGIAAFSAASALLCSVTPDSVGAQALQTFLTYLSLGKEHYKCLNIFYETLHQLVQVHSSSIPIPHGTPRHPFFARYEPFGIQEPSYGAPLRALPPLPDLPSPPAQQLDSPALDLNFNFGVGEGEGGATMMMDPTWFGNTSAPVFEVGDLTAEEFDVFAFLASPSEGLWSH